MLCQTITIRWAIVNAHPCKGSLVTYWFSRLSFTLVAISGDDSIPSRGMQFTLHAFHTRSALPVHQRDPLGRETHPGL